MIIPIDNNRLKFNIKAIAIDTNVLLWTFYGNTTYVQAYQKNIYPNFLVDAIENKKCKIYTTMYNICELFNVIEKNEYELYIKANSLQQEDFNRKQYRAIITERERIQKMFKLLYSQISQCINIIEYNIDDKSIKEYIGIYNLHRYDIFDFTLVKFCKENNIKCILSDDADFTSCVDDQKDITIITANKKMK